jgi:hypothetical protein
MNQLVRMMLFAPVGGIAQLVERLVRNEKVGGSNPPTSTNFFSKSVAQNDEVFRERRDLSATLLN